MTRRNTLPRALARFALVASAALAAASLWAQTRPEQGLLLDAQTWQEEVVTAATGPWPEQGWYRIVAGMQGVEVRGVKPTDADAAPADALFFRLRGTALKTGMHANQMPLEMLAPAAAGRFSVQVEEVAAGVQYTIGYGGHTYTYLVGPTGASTNVRGVADLDGDGRPDFVIDVEGETTYLLLSSQARPGPNLPTAELPAHGA